MDFEAIYNECAKDTGKFRRRLYETGIKTIGENNGDRMIMYTDVVTRSRPDINKHYMISKYNGLIIDMDTWNILCSPQNSFIDVMFARQQDLEQLWKKNVYDVYKLNDGTTINLYWYKSKWTMSTTKGMEMNDIKWIGKLIRKC